MIKKLLLSAVNLTADNDNLIQLFYTAKICSLTLIRGIVTFRYVNIRLLASKYKNI